jgi:hypothetical protein
MVRKKNPEDGKELSTLTRVILNDLKGRREIHHDFRQQKKIQPIKKTKEKEDVTDHTQWMPKHIPHELKRAIRETEKPKKKPPSPQKKISVRKEKDIFEYVVQLRSGKTMQAKRVIIRGENVILINEEMKTEVPAQSIKWIREKRVRVLTLQIGISTGKNSFSQMR